nr:GNAT family N-acetyltransferase [Octadecabacter temperatus]
MTSWVTGEGASRTEVDSIGANLNMAKDSHSLEGTVLARGDYVARFAVTADDLERSQRLRHRCFIEEAGGVARRGGIETDGFDSLCDHVLVEDPAGKLICSFRILYAASGDDVAASYSAQFYDLTRLAEYAEPMLELGRFCVSPDVQDPDVLRIAWGMLAQVVDARSVGLLFGCSSFAGTDAVTYGDAFALLAANHQAPKVWTPAVKATDVVPFGDLGSAVTRKVAMEQLPALLKTYLSMGGWVSDHAVVDTQMNTLHVFTGLEIAAIPPARAKALRAISGD